MQTQINDKPKAEKPKVDKAMLDVKIADKQKLIDDKKIVHK
jgi:hypothetical protein